MKNIFGMTLEELQEEFSAARLEKYRAKQVASWLYQKHAKSFAAMTNLPKSLRAALSEKYCIDVPALRTRLDAADGLRYARNPLRRSSSAPGHPGIGPRHDQSDLSRVERPGVRPGPDGMSQYLVNNCMYKLRQLRYCLLGQPQVTTPHATPRKGAR